MAAWCDGMEEPRLLIAPVPCTSDVRKDANQIAKAEGSILLLRHPKSGSPTSYVFLNGALLELNWFKQAYGSWFLGNYVCEDGSLYMTTKVDPIFIFLPLFKDARMKKGNDQGMFRQLNEILYIDGHPGYHQLVSLAEESMQLICEVKEIGSSKYFRLDDSKVLAWMVHKVHQLKDALTKLDKNYAILDEKDILKDSISILGEYLEESWLTLLCNHFKLDIQEANRSAEKNAPEVTFLETPPTFAPFEAKPSSGKKQVPTSGKQSKKPKTETNSKNIKDMFSRASRRRT